MSKVSSPLAPKGAHWPFTAALAVTVLIAVLMLGFSAHGT